jgi:hypothetical protein
MKISVHERVRDRVQILFDGEPATKVELVVVEIHNTGYEAIRASDFERPVAIKITNDASILSAYIDETHPANLMPQIEVKANIIEVQPLLLNRDDRFRALLLVSGSPLIEIDGRIAGVGKIRRVQRFENRRIRPLLEMLVLMAVGLIFYLIQISHTKSEFFAGLVALLLIAGFPAFVVSQI